MDFCSVPLIDDFGEAIDETALHSDDDLAHESHTPHAIVVVSGRAQAGAAGDSVAASAGDAVFWPTGEPSVIRPLEHLAYVEIAAPSLREEHFTTRRR